MLSNGIYGQLYKETKKLCHSSLIYLWEVMRVVVNTTRKNLKEKKQLCRQLDWVKPHMMKKYLCKY